MCIGMGADFAWEFRVLSLNFFFVVVVVSEIGGGSWNLKGFIARLGARVEDR